MKKSEIFRIAAALGALVIVVAAALSIGTTYAAKGAKPGGGSTGAATLAVSPNPVPAFSWFNVSGCGYVPGEGVQFNLWTDFAISTTAGPADSNGCVAFPLYAHQAGTYKLTASTGRRNTTVASITFQVY